jgi:sugar phosphate isomerase/epimerase
MATRRSFLGSLTGGAATAALVSRARAASAARAPLGLQLYSVRDQLAKDVPGTLRQVKAWGFDEVESYGPYGASLAGALEDAGLRCGAIHVGYELLTSDLAGVLRDADALGARTIVNPYLPHEAKPHATREEILKAAGDFARWSKACRAAGKRFAYHIHGHEFGKAETGTLFDVLATESGPDVGFEADVFWVMVGGADPVELMRRHPGRFWFTHLKDMAKGTLPAREGQDFNRACVVLGTGVIDIKGIVAAGAEAGVEIHYLEDESPDVLTQVPKSIAVYRGL